MGMAICLLLGACASEKPVQVGGEVSDLYHPPATYQEHRDQQQWFDSSGGRMAYTDTGDGPVLVLLHGVPTSSWLFRKVIPQLQNHMRVVSVDMLGFGSSDKPKNEHDIYSSKAHAERVSALLEHLEIETYSVLMHDMGGLVAWEMLALHPDNIDRFVVLDTIINKQGFNHPNIKPGPFTEMLMNVYSSDLTSAKMLEQTFGGFGLKGKYALSEAECHGYVVPMKEGADQALYAFYTSVDADLFAKLDAYESNFRAFDGAALVLWGGQDTVLTTGQIPILQETMRIPDENIHVFDQSNHFLSEQVPDEISAKIISFMTE